MGTPAPTPTFDLVYGEWFDEVVRWARAFGGAPSELDDLAQEVFVVVGRKLQAFDGDNLPGWLYGITKNTVSDYRRRSWFRQLWRGSDDSDVDTVLLDDRSGPAEMLERKQARELLFSMLQKMSEKRRSAFVLFEIEGYSGEEIARLEGVPLQTVWTRIFHARKELELRIAELRAEGET